MPTIRRTIADIRHELRYSERQSVEARLLTKREWHAGRAVGLRKALRLAMRLEKEEGEA